MQDLIVLEGLPKVLSGALCCICIYLLRVCIQCLLYRTQGHERTRAHVTHTVCCFHVHIKLIPSRTRRARTI